MSAQFRRTFAEVICRQRRRGSDGQAGTPTRRAPHVTDGGMLLRWRVILRSRTAPVTNLLHCTGIFSSSPSRSKQPSPV